MALAVAAANPDITIFLNDKLPGVAAVWDVVACSDDNIFQEFCRRFQVLPTVEMFLRIRETPDTFDSDGAFRTLFLNKTAYGGLLHGGPIGGITQSGKWKIGCQYTPDSIIKCLSEARRLLHGRTSVTCGDWRDAEFSGTLFIDPPYFVPGNALYRATMTAADHQDLAARLRRHNGVFAATYDNAPEIREMYTWATVAELTYRYSAASAYSNTWRNQTELLITNSC